MAMIEKLISVANLRDLHPAYFALVMATEIVATACNLEELNRIAEALAIIGAIAFLVLAGMNLLRLVLFPRALFDDFGDHNRGVGFFTIVAGTAVLGSTLDSIFHLYRQLRHWSVYCWFQKQLALLLPISCPSSKD